MAQTSLNQAVGRARARVAFGQVCRAAVLVIAGGCDPGGAGELSEIGRSVNPLTVTYLSGGIINTTVLSDDTPCAGTPVLVAATATDPSNASLPVAITIDGSPGSPQIVQLMAPSPSRQIEVFARTRSGATERKVLTVAVADCPATTATLKMFSSQNPYHPGRVDFRAKFTGRRARVFRWFFGDGQQQVTTEPFVTHDYAGLVNHGGVFTQFTAFVQETSSGLASGRRISVGSTVATSRQMGFVQADVRTALTKTGTGFAVDLEILNRESTPIVFDHYIKQYLPCDTREHPRVVHVAAESVFGPSTTVVHPPGPPTPGTVTLPVGRPLRTRMVVPLEKVPPETCALGFNLVGRSGGKSAYGSFYFPVRRNREHTRKVNDVQTLLALEHLVKQNLVPDDNHVDGEDLHQLKQRGLIATTKAGVRRVK